MKLEETMPNPIFLDLKPNRLLLDPKFDGYKLSLEPLPKYQRGLDNLVDKAGPADEQYSIQHAKLFANYNCLHTDFWNPSLFFIVDRDWNIGRVFFDAQAVVPAFQPIENVWSIPTRTSQKLGRYNVTITFISEQYAAISDGCGTLFILDTGDRMTCNSWKIIKQEQPFAEQSTNDMENNFIILDAINYKVNDEEHVDILMMRLIDRNEKTMTDFLDSHDNHYLRSTVKHPFITSLEWINYLRTDNNEWTIKSKRTLIGPSRVDYASIESNGTGILIASENHFAFFKISDTEIKYSGLRHKKKDNSHKPDYVWMQSDKDIKVWLKIPIGATKADINVDLQPSSISLTLNGNLMIEGEFIHNIKSDEATWTTNSMTVVSDDTENILTSDEENGSTHIVQNNLEILLPKTEADMKWDGDSILKGSSCGIQIFDPEVAANVHQFLAHMCSDKWNADPVRTAVCDPEQLEECDSFPADTTSFMRIDLGMQCISHSASLGGHQWLCSSKVGDFKTPAICIRHDVDGLIWQPTELPTLSNGNNSENISTAIDWKLEHIGTFSAMGYVQASKQQRRFTVIPPDLSYAAICDTVKHIYLYQQPNQLQTDLRNRRTGHRVSHIAKQQIISIEPPLDVLGAHASNEFLYILTSRNIHAFRVKSVVEDY